MKRITRIVIAVLAATVLLGAGSQGLVAKQDAPQQVASLCCYRQ
jgi:hypothetical protein